MMRDAWEEQGFAPEQVEALMPYGRESSLQTETSSSTRSPWWTASTSCSREVEISRLDGAAEIPIGTHGPGEFTGGLVLLTGRTSIHRGRAGAPSRVLEIDSETFRRMPAEVPDLADIFISGLARRMRYTQRAYRQRELAALGKLSAGLAHELNNPAAAARRPPRRVGRGNPRGPTHLLDARALLRQRTRGAGSPATRNGSGQCRTFRPALSRRRRGSALRLVGRSWLWEPWDMAPALAEAGLDTDRLEAMAGAFDDRSLACGLEWLAGTLDLLGLASEIETSTGRISELVGAMKEYTYMDRAVVGEVDVISGLQNTITILGPRLKDVSLSREYEKDLPGIPGRGGELNQVWTNLIDNAIDAVDGRGSITIRAYVEGAAWWWRSSTTGVGYRARRRSTSSSLSTPQGHRGRDRARAGYRKAHRHRSWRRGLCPVRAWETCFTVRLPLDTTQNGG